MKRTVRYHDYLIKTLKEPAEAAEYLSAVAEDGDIKFILKALRNIVEAQGKGISCLQSGQRFFRELAIAARARIQVDFQFFPQLPPPPLFYEVRRRATMIWIIV